MNRISDIMVSVLVSSVVDRGFEPGWVKPKTIKLVFVASPLSMQHKGERAKTGWLEIRIMCLTWTTCLSADCCFSELAL
jgi:hypothetical protein